MVKAHYWLFQEIARLANEWQVHTLSVYQLEKTLSSEQHVRSFVVSIVQMCQSIASGKCCKEDRFSRLLVGRANNDDMAKHSLLMVVFSLSMAFFNWVYQIVMGHWLSPEEFGAMVTLLSILVIFTLLTRTFQISASKFTSKFRVQGGTENICHLWRFLLGRTVILGVVLFMIGAVLAPPVSSFLKLADYWPWLAFSVSFILVAAVPVNRGVLQGTQRFLALGLTMVAESASKLVFGFLLVYVLGYGVCGAVFPLALSLVIVFALSLFLLRDIICCKANDHETLGLISYTTAAFLAILPLGILTNADMLLARHYLDETTSGDYAALVVLGKVAFFAPFGVVLAMFPKTSEAAEVGRSPGGVLSKAILYTFALGGGVVLMYFLFSGPIVELLYQGKYVSMTPLLARYALAMFLLALSFLLVNYALSLGRTMVVLPLIMAAVLQVCLISLFHSSMAQITDIMIVCGLVTVVLVIPFCLASIAKGTPDSNGDVDATAHNLHAM